MTRVDWPLGDSVVCWQRETGRHAVLSPEAAAAPSPAVRQRLERLHLAGPPAPVDALLVVRSRLPLLLPGDGALWVPVPGVRTAGGHAWRALPLTPVEVRAWRAASGARTLSQVARAAGTDIATVRALVHRLTAPDVQAVQLRDRPPHPRDLSLERLVAAPRERGVRTADMGDDATTLGAWHHGLTGEPAHFDDRETTLAHTLAVPHPALGGVPWGARLRQVLTDRGLVPDPGRVVEVGCGTGELAAAWCALPRAHTYLRVDRSPGLLATQARAAPGTAGLLGDAEALPLADGTVDLLVSNEVLADLSSVRADATDPRVAPWRSRAGLAPRSGWHNLGTWRLLAELRRVLRPGGAAYLSEFGSLDEPPAETEHLDHPEVSIHFGELAAVARHLSLAVEVLPLAELMGLDLSARWLWRPHYEALRALAASRGDRLEARAWTATTAQEHLGLIVEGLRDVPLAEEGPGPVVTRFYAVIVRA